MQRSANDYPTLSNLLSGWFHQDFDIEGETVEEIIGKYNASCSVEERQTLIEDISRFLEIEDDMISQEFDRIFDPDIEPTGFAPTTRAFLEQIRLNLSKANES